MKVFMIMGVLATISAAISSARLNSATNSLGTLDEFAGYRGGGGRWRHITCWRFRHDHRSDARRAADAVAAVGHGAQVGELVKQLKADGIGIFLISHDIHDVFDRQGLRREKRSSGRHRANRGVIRTKCWVCWKMPA